MKNKKPAWLKNWNYKTHEPPVAESQSRLVDAVMLEMERHIKEDDWTSIDELLRFVPRKNLIGFLPEDQWKKYLRKGETV